MPISITDSIQLKSALPLDSRSVAKSVSTFSEDYPDGTYAAGQVTYFTDDKELKVYDGSSWQTICPIAPGVDAGYVLLPNTTSSWTWGTLTTSAGYTQLGDYDESGGGSFAVAAKNGQISVQIDGKFYDNEGQSKVLSTQDVTWDSSTGVLTISL